MKKIFTKFSFGYLIVVTLLTSLIVFISYSTIRSHYIDESANNLYIYSDLVISDLHLLNFENDTSEISELISIFAQSSHIRITIIKENGIVIYDSDENPKLMENHKNRPEILDLEVSQIGQSIRFSKTVGEDMLYVARIIKNNNKVYYLRTSLFVDNMNKLLHEVRSDIIEISLFVYFISIIGLLFFSKNISNPIKQLSNASKKVADGDFDVKVKIKTNDELGDLSKNFNNMTKQLKKLFYKVNSQKEQLDTLISSIQEGLVVLDSKGRIKLYNASFAEMIGLDNLIGLKLTRLIKNSQLKKLINEVVANDTSITKEIDVNNRQYICSTSWINIKNEVIILLYDITELNKLETIKKDFVINVSHELRTPLTAIKGFSETLVDELEESESKRYAKIINKHTNRLINIVNDLLSLSEIENSSSNLILENIKVADIIENVYNLFIQKSIEKDIKLVKLVENPNRILNVDNFKIEQLLVNLVDNAFKYTDTGKIMLHSYEEAERQIFEIEDTGIGIPKEDINRIFERFYTVDKSRSRQVGGTGLGLSIVKHIVLLHNGKIDISSNKNEGTKFKISIPFAQNQIQ